MNIYISFNPKCKIEQSAVRRLYGVIPTLKFSQSLDHNDYDEKCVVLNWSIMIENMDIFKKNVIDKTWSKSQSMFDGNMIVVIPGSTVETYDISEGDLGVKLNTFMADTNFLKDVTNEELKQHMKSLTKQWTGYRFGDGFVDPWWDDWNTGDQTKLCEYLHERFPSSLIGEYSEKNEFKRERNQKLLKEIVDRRNIFDDTISCVGIHLRCGDVLRRKTVHEQLRYIQPEVYGNLAKQLMQNGLTKVVLIFGLHFYYDNIANLTVDYVRTVTRLMEEQGIEVKYRVGTPDEDVMFMTNVEHLVPAISHYSIVIQKELAKGNIIKLCKSRLKYDN